MDIRLLELLLLIKSQSRTNTHSDQNYNSNFYTTKEKWKSPDAIDSTEKHSRYAGLNFYSERVNYIPNSLSKIFKQV